ncbi:recombinase family protein [Roseomonas alkaliterrae]|uniref:DNA invertase Pin-like site-specific DNA recombinase n=1 Tax=Neoroseomonas alkaliterrae TaxID=1452450 RepID=A0A840Y6X7_9PROT|nr:recombinase family protein [Neoroseomonas alkaliterrae]MBB5691701.1 DNA invertase Pin-like site-specific DNA recombinase [Neoroseomonas alkaliterrae]MBR0677298.1 recombinase family protein [Neoroseomonas alkaliterrae]
MSRRKLTDGAMPASVKKLRCAVYTRKSTDEGLDKDFNTLDAQREACEAYIASQRAEGWMLVRDRYDDGGFSGGTLERPGLKRLLGDIEVGLIDVIVVYKIDRLSRSLMDFAKLVETFEAHQVTFVSVTQSFNTTTSMGRLTLNILLSFAQFEREVIGERIRDKVAASKARGMWMGGKVPLGYDVDSRKLVVNKLEAARVRRVFELFVETGSGIETVRRLQAEGVTAKSSRPLDKGDVYKILNLRTYIGEVTHKGNVYRGEHEAIVPRDLWDRAHAILQVSPRTRAAQNRQHAPALLKGLIFGVDGRALSPTHCVKKGRLYRYYVAQSVLKGGPDHDDGLVRRVSAAEIEAAVVDQVRALLRQPEVVVGTWLAARKEAPDLTEGEARDALHRLDPLWDELFPAEQARIVRALVERVIVGPTGADIRLRVEGLAGLVRDLGAISPGALRAAA